MHWGSCKRSAAAFHGHEQRITATLPLAARQVLDEVLMQCDRALLWPEGLPRRPWYRNQIYAPDFYTGYSPKTIPGVREAIEERRWDDANAQIPLAAQVLEAMPGQIDRASAIHPGGE